MGKKETKALAVIPPSDYAIANMEGGNVAEAIAANLGECKLTEFDLERIGMPSGGAKFWEIDGEPVGEILGVIIDHRDGGAYWTKSFDETGGGVPPDCVSNDGFTGVGEPGGECDKCALNKFGSAVNKDGTAGKGKACRNMKILFLLRPEDILPIVIVAPPTSLTAIRKYLVKLAARGIKFKEAVTRLTLEERQNTTGINFSRLVVSKAADLSEKEKAMIQAYSESMAPMMQRDIEIQQGEVDTE